MHQDLIIEFQFEPDTDEDTIELVESTHNAVIQYCEKYGTDEGRLFIESLADLPDLLDMAETRH